jgi:hypothetical protein
MGETTDQIESYIESKRGDLGSNLQELEQKVKSVTDWRQRFQKNPMTMIAVAFGGGVLLASVLGGRSRNRHVGVASEPHSPHAGTDQMAHKALETWDNIKGALIGVAATRFKDFVGEVIPGFHEQLRNTENIKKVSLPGDATSANARSAS